MLICNIIVIPNKNKFSKKNLSEEDKDMIVNENSLVIQNNKDIAKTKQQRADQTLGREFL